MNLKEIKTLLKGNIDPYIGDQVMQLVNEINTAYEITRSSYAAKCRDMRVLKRKVYEGVSDDSQLIKRTLHKFSRYESVTVYFDRITRKFSVRTVRFTDTLGLELVGCYTAPYDLQAVKEDLEYTLLHPSDHTV